MYSLRKYNILHVNNKSLMIIIVLLLAFVLCSVRGLGVTSPQDYYDYNENEVKWGLTNANKTDTCILLNGILQVIVSYDSRNVLMKGVALITVPRNASVAGRCGALVQNMTLSWAPKSGLREDEPPTDQHRLTLTFVKKGVLLDPDLIVNGTELSSFVDPYYELNSVDGVFYAGEAEFPDFNPDRRTYTLKRTNLGLLSAPVNLSYYCQTSQAIYSAESDGNEDPTTLVLSYVQAQAFHYGLSDTAPDGVDFGPRSYCPTDGYQMIFAVVGYVAIGVLVCVAIFFALNRRRQRNGYVYF